MKKEAELDNLFRDWMQAHRQNAESDCFVHENSFRYFAVDGPVDWGEWESTDKQRKILYILREPNWSAVYDSIRSGEDICGESSNGNDDDTLWKKKDDFIVEDFWFRRVVLGEGRGYKGGLIGSRLCAMQNAALSGEADTYDRSWQSLKSAAYMNLSKCGGLSAMGRTGRKRMQNYCGIFASNIKREIELLDPGLIVCCGTYQELMHIVGYDGGAEVIDMPHPSRRCTNQAYLKLFSERTEPHRSSLP